MIGNTYRIRYLWPVATKTSYLFRYSFLFYNNNVHFHLENRENKSHIQLHWMAIATSYIYINKLRLDYTIFFFTMEKKLFYSTLNILPQNRRSSDNIYKDGRKVNDKFNYIKFRFLSIWCCYFFSIRHEFQCIIYDFCYCHL